MRVQNTCASTSTCRVYRLLPFEQYLLSVAFVCHHGCCFAGPGKPAMSVRPPDLHCNIALFALSIPVRAFCTSRPGASPSISLMQAASRDINNQPDSRLAFLIPTRLNPNISLVYVTRNHFSNNDTRKKTSYFTKQTNVLQKKLINSFWNYIKTPQENSR